jgi:hypothetical protein
LIWAQQANVSNVTKFFAQTIPSVVSGVHTPIVFLAIKINFVFMEVSARQAGSGILALVSNAAA